MATHTLHARLTSRGNHWREHRAHEVCGPLALRRPQQGPTGMGSCWSRWRSTEIVHRRHRGQNIVRAASSPRPGCCVDPRRSGEAREKWGETSEDIGDPLGVSPGTTGRTSKKTLHGSGTPSFQAIDRCPRGTLNRATGAGGASREEDQRLASSFSRCVLP